MDIQRRRLLQVFLAGAAATSAPSRFAIADDYPSRPITLMVGFAAGGPTDVYARILAEPLQSSLGVPVIVENVAGAAGTIATGRVASAAPDGYTLDIGPGMSTHVINGAIYNLAYDVVADFTPVALLSFLQQVILAKKAIPADDLNGLIAWLKANPGLAMQATSGAGSPGHIAGILFQKETDTQFGFVPYRGLGPALQDLVAGRVDLMIDAGIGAMPFVRDGSIKAYAIMAKDRLETAPDIPTVDEAGMPGFYSSLWQAIFAPKGTPQEVVAKLNSAAVKALADPQIRARLAKLGHVIVSREQQTPQALAAYQKSEIAKWWPIIKAAGITTN
jgi:tripartite-type tricarboxylate transporter receptor subunit TctC